MGFHLRSPAGANSHSFKNAGGKVILFMNTLDNISLILVIIGALNWGCIGLFGLDVVGFLLSLIHI